MNAGKKIGASMLPAKSKQSLTATIVVGAGTLGLIAIALSFAARRQEFMPPHALVLVRDASRTYASPPCVMAKNTSHTYAHFKNLDGSDGMLARGVRLVKAEEAYRLTYSTDDKCRESGGFIGRNQSFIASYLFPGKSRWDKAGDWMW